MCASSEHLAHPSLIAYILLFGFVLELPFITTPFASAKIWFQKRELTIPKIGFLIEIFRKYSTPRSVFLFERIWTILKPELEPELL